MAPGAAGALQRTWPQNTAACPCAEAGQAAECLVGLDGCLILGVAQIPVVLLQEFAVESTVLLGGVLIGLQGE